MLRTSWKKMMIIGLLGLMLLSACTAAVMNDPVNEPTTNEALSMPSPEAEEAEMSQYADLVGKELHAEIPRAIVDDLPAQALDELVFANNHFAFNLYAELAGEQEGNLVLSPFSIALALAMVYGGAEGETLTEMTQVLNYPAEFVESHAAWNALMAEMESRAEPASEHEEGISLNINNGVWAQVDYPFEQDYLNLLAQQYDAGLRLADFKHDPETARALMNAWVAKQTEDRIQELLPEGVVHELTRLALINTIYYNAAWRFPFNEEVTADAVFTLLDGTEIQTPMMNQQLSTTYLVIDELSMVSMPYSGGDMEMLFIMPHEGQFLNIERSLYPMFLGTLLDRQEWGEIRLSLPSYQFDSDIDLKKTLSEMGMPTAFIRGKADFSGITKAEELFIDAALHKAFIDVNEKGTEAAAATAILLAGKGMPVQDPIEIKFDKPFFFILRDNGTGSILFIGRVMNPAE